MAFYPSTPFDPSRRVGPLNWSPDGAKCFLCGEAFGVFMRRHHCRMCGENVCGNCSMGRLKVRELLDVASAPQRVCDKCFESHIKRFSKPDSATLSEYPPGEQFWLCDPEAEIKVRVSEKGIASEPPITVFELLQRAVKRNGREEALRIERGGDDKWISWTWAQYFDDIMTAARAFIVLGMKRFQSVNMLGFNAPEWLIADLGAIIAGGIATGIYTTNEADACKYIASHSEAAVAVVENEAQLRKFLKIRDELPHLKAIVVYNDKVPEDANVSGKTPVYTWQQFMEFGRNSNDEVKEELDRRIADQRPGHCCTLIYTSGTTGNPKAVMISHDNVTWTAKCFTTTVPFPGKHPERVVSYLPLNHIAAQMLDIYAPIYITSIGKQSTIWFARPTALKGTLGQTLVSAQPTLFFGVPRVWEKIQEKMKKLGAKSGGLKRAIANWAKDQGRAKNEAEQMEKLLNDKGVGAENSFWYVMADALVFGKVKLALGLDQARVCYTGAAPISKDTLQYFGSLDISILELYGMSECTGPQNTCMFNFRQAGSCGVPLPGTELMIDHQPDRDNAGEGEICYRGRHIMMGYMKDVEKTRETIDPNGFLHSGDVGRVDERGLLYITGRLKELIIGAGGENVAPVPVEDCIKKELPAISNAMMVGDKRKYNVVLITLKTGLDEKTGLPTNQLVDEATQVSPDSKTVEEAQKDPIWEKYITEGVKRANKQAVSNAAKLQKFRILPQDFSIPGGELTPTLKLKRAVVQIKYSALIDELYAEDEED